MDKDKWKNEIEAPTAEGLEPSDLETYILRKFRYTRIHAGAVLSCKTIFNETLKVGTNRFGRRSQKNCEMNAESSLFGLEYSFHAQVVILLQVEL